MKRVTNHPVHLIDSFGNLSPSAFIPFCSFGGNRDILGKKIGKFHTPVCNSFTEKVFDGQVCYEIDLNVYKENMTNVRMDMKEGLALVLDINKDRQSEIYEQEDANLRFAGDRIKFYLNSIGKTNNQKSKLFCSFSTLVPDIFTEEGDYNFNVLKQIEVTDSFLTLSQDARKCQNEEPYENCTTEIMF